MALQFILKTNFVFAHLEGSGVDFWGGSRVLKVRIIAIQP